MTPSLVCGCHSGWVSFRLEDLSQFPCFTSLHVWVFCVGIEAIVKHLGCFSCPLWVQFLGCWFLWFFPWPLCPDHTWVPELYRAVCWLLHTVQICWPFVWSGWEVKDLGQSVVSGWVSAISLVCTQPVYLLSHRLECWWCFYKPPWVKCTVVALSVRRGDLSSFIITYGGPEVFLVSIWVSVIHTIVFERDSVMYTPQHTQLSNLNTSKIWLIYESESWFFFFYCSCAFSPLWQEWGREQGREEKACPRDSLLIFCD